MNDYRLDDEELFIRLHWRNFVCILIYSILFFSQFSIDIFTIGGKYYGELALISCLILSIFFKDVFFIEIGRAICNANFILISIFILIIGLLGWYLRTDFPAAYSDARANILFIAGVFIGLKLSKKPEWIIYFYYCAVFTGIFSVIYWVSINFFGFSDRAQISTKYASMMMAAILSLVLSADLQSENKLIFAFILMAFLSAISFYRQYWLVSILGFFFTIGFARRNGKLSKLIFFIFLVLLLSIPLVPWDSLFSYFIDNESRYIQLVGKTTDIIELLSGQSSMTDSDSLRMAYYQIIIDRPLFLILPHGLGYKAVLGNVSDYFDVFGIDENTIDSCFFYFFYHYGLLLFVIILTLALYFIIVCGYSRARSSYYLIFIMVFILMIFDGSQFTVMQKSIWFGICFGYAIVGGIKNRSLAV